MTTAPDGPGPTGTDPTMTAATRGVALAAVAMTLVAFLAGGAGIGFGVAAGGAIATANLLVFARIGRAFIEQRGATAPWAIIAVLKLAALLLGVWLLVRSELVSGLWLGVGYGALPLGITLGTLFGPKPPGDPPITDAIPRDEDVLKGGPIPPADPPREGD